MSGRIRSIKPEVGKNAELWDLAVETGLPVYQAYTMLWCHADREGRFKWKPRELKTDILPYFEGDCAKVLDALASKGFIVKYSVDGSDYGWIPTFKEHQLINHREAQSKLPSPPVLPVETTVQGTPGHTPGEGVGKGRDRGREGNDASPDADDDDDPPSRIHPKPEPTRPDNAKPEPAPRTPGTPPKPRQDITTLLAPHQWSPSPDGLAYAQELGLTEATIAETLTELRNWKGTRAWTIDWWDTKWLTFVEKRSQWAKEPKPRKAHGAPDSEAEKAKARQAFSFLRNGSPVKAEVVG